MSSRYDVIVVGGTPGGIAAAIAAARAGCRVSLTEYHRHLGGMATSGLGKSDVIHREMIGGIFTEFTSRIRAYYAQTYGEDSADYARCRDGYYYEPSVAEAALNAMLAECEGRLDLFRYHQLTAVETAAGTAQGVTLRCRRTGESCQLYGRVLVDATYEGDLYAMAGAAYRLGREARNDFDEPHAGLIYYDYERHEILPGTTGEGDDRLPAYTYRLCFTTDPDNSYRLTEPPAGYDRQTYLPYLEDLEAGRLSAPAEIIAGRGYCNEHFDTLMRAFSVTELPNRKTDVNINPRPLSFPFAEENAGYVEGDWETRERICQRHRELALGLLYFLQQDAAVPEAQRAIANRYHLPLDEFSLTDHFPFQLYVREARRLIGEAILTERDVTHTDDTAPPPMAEERIAMGEFPIDSFPCQKRQPGDDIVLEGYLGMLQPITRPYGIPYRIMIPETLDGIIVPVAASTTHVAYSSIRMEPTWMAMGQAAGTAAALAIRQDVSLRQVDVASLQDTLRTNGQIIL